MPTLKSNKTAANKKVFDTFKYKKVHMLTINDVKEISQLPLGEAKEVLTFKLGLNTYYDEEDQLKPIFVDYLLDSLNFAVDRGFPWGSVCHAIEFAYQFIRGICWNAEGDSLTDAILTFKTKAGRLETLTDRQKMMYIDHMSDNVFRHYNLYRLVFCKPREKAIAKFTRLVEPPEAPLPLHWSRKVDPSYIYDKEMARLEKKNIEVKQRLQDARDQTSANRWRLPPVQDPVREMMGAPVSWTNAETAARGIANTILETQKADFEDNVNKLGEALDMRLAMKIVPVPEGYKAKEATFSKTQRASKI